MGFIFFLYQSFRNTDVSNDHEGLVVIQDSL